MSRREPEDRTVGPIGRRARLRGYLRRFFTSWVAEDPEPCYSQLDRRDGLGEEPTPCPADHPVPESEEVAEHVPGADRTKRVVGGRVGL
jgi:hypothetical protein